MGWMAQAAGCQKNKDQGHNPRDCVKPEASSLKGAQSGRRSIASRLPALPINQAFLEQIPSGQPPGDSGHPLELGWVFPSLATRVPALGQGSLTGEAWVQHCLKYLWTQTSMRQPCAR